MNIEVKTYTKRPVPIKAVQWQGGMAQAQEIARLRPAHFAINLETTHYFNVMTKNGWVAINEGDYVVISNNGDDTDVYPISRDVFEKTYSEAPCGAGGEQDAAS